MKLQEAYKILEIPEGSDEETAKKAFKTKAKVFHPDVNKEPDAESKFKEINTAYDRIKSGESDDIPQGFGGGWGGFNINDILSSMGGFGGGRRQSRYYNKPDITLTETVSFKEAVLGCTREVSFKKDEKCPYCDGEGSMHLDNGCKKCGGRGVVVIQRGNTIMQSACTDCRGKVNQKTCDKCNGLGYKSADARFTVNVPAGLTPEKNIVNIGNVGHYCGRAMMGEQYSKVLIAVSITPQDDLRLVDNDVVCGISISLLEALEGTTKMVPTIDGQRSTVVVAGVKNKDEIVIPHLGMRRQGNQRVIVNVEYPNDTGKLIEKLKEMQ